MAQNKELTFDDFRKLASNKKLSKYEKIGFPDSYRKGKEELIYEDILRKLPISESKGKTVIDIGCGCSDVALLNIELCAKQGHRLILVDSEEMLKNLPNAKGVEKIPGLYPEINSLFKKYTGKVDFAIAYSLLHYVFNQNNMFAFIHKTVDLLKPGGRFLVGDIPNTSKRERFISSAEGKKFLQNAAKANAEKGATFHEDQSEKIDDAIVMAILQRLRNFDCETYLLPQSADLPMANRREDILIVKR